MRVPAAYVEEGEIELLAHEPGHPARHDIEAARADGVAAGGAHLVIHTARLCLRLAANHAAQLQPFVDQGFKPGPDVHARQELHVSIVDRTSRPTPKRDVRHHDVADHHGGEALGE
jgi:hypothetical protein